jgi:hypothetical protein
MPRIHLRAGEALWGSLEAHLLGDGVEQVAFLLADLSDGDSTADLHLREIARVAPLDFTYQGAFHVSLADDVRPRMIKWAWDRGSCLVEAHSHLEGPAAFSPTDLAGLEEFVPHMWWRLQRPYAALVLAPDGFDGLAWVHGPEAPVGIDGVRIDGGRDLKPTTGITARTLWRKLSRGG